MIVAAEKRSLSARITFIYAYYNLQDQSIRARVDKAATQISQLDAFCSVLCDPKATLAAEIYHLFTINLPQMRKYRTIPRNLASAGGPKRGGGCHVLARDEEGFEV